MQHDQRTLDLLAEIALHFDTDLKHIISQAIEHGIENSDCEESTLSRFGLFKCEESERLCSELDLIITYEDERISREYAIQCPTTHHWFNAERYSIAYFRPYDRGFCTYWESDGNTFDVGSYSVLWLNSEGSYWDTGYLYYWESDGEYHTESEPEYNFNYHGSSPAFKATLQGPKIGFEIEKEDLEAKESWFAHELQSKHGWGKENDGSLDCESGFELVSPVFSLHESKEYFLSEFCNISELINAEYSNNCGGHINYSHPDFSTIDLLESIKGYLPLFYSIYEHRINSRWSRAKSSKDLIRDREKYQSVNIKSQCIEFRIFPAVRNIKNLIWRLELIQIMDLNKTKSPLQVINWLADLNHPLHLHFAKVFSFESIMRKINLVAKYAYQLENITIPERTLSEAESNLIVIDLNK